jgi:hypothetical protein
MNLTSVAAAAVIELVLLLWELEDDDGGRKKAEGIMMKPISQQLIDMKVVGLDWL